MTLLLNSIEKGSVLLKKKMLFEVFCNASNINKILKRKGVAIYSKNQETGRVNA